MASIASSSAMTFNLLGNDYMTVLPDCILPFGVYDVEYEKRMHTLAYGNRPAHLDAFLSDEINKTAIFCEMKPLEWLGEPSSISRTYFTDKHYFKADESAVNFLKEAFEFFAEGKLLFHGCPLDAAEAYGKFLNYLYSHDKIWRKYYAPKYNVDFDYYPRGRVIYRKSDETYLIYYDKCMEAFIGVVTEKYVGYKTELGYDEHYQCHMCNEDYVI